MKMLTIRISEELHKTFKIKCVTEGTDMSNVVVSLIENYVKTGKSKTKK
jgi:hypothetical protein